MGWVIWVVVAVVALAGELLSLGLFLASFGVAALATAAVAQVAPVLVQLGVFCVLSAIFLFLIRPAVLPLLPVRSGPDLDPKLGPVDKIGTVTRRVDQQRGQIRVGVGEFWSARLEHPGPAAEVGTEVQVTGMSGLTVLVTRIALTLDVSELSPSGRADAAGLSRRELEVLRLVAQGRSNQEIAHELVLSPRTVDHHVSHILTKLDAESRLEATRIAIRRGLVPND